MEKSIENAVASQCPSNKAALLSLLPGSTPSTPPLPAAEPEVDMSGDAVEYINVRACVLDAATSSAPGLKLPLDKLSDSCRELVSLFSAESLDEFGSNQQSTPVAASKQDATESTSHRIEIGFKKAQDSIKHLDDDDTEDEAATNDDSFSLNDYTPSPRETPIKISNKRSRSESSLSPTTPRTSSKKKSKSSPSTTTPTTTSTSNRRTKGAHSSSKSSAKRKSSIAAQPVLASIESVGVLIKRVYVYLPLIFEIKAVDSACADDSVIKKIGKALSHTFIQTRFNAMIEEEEADLTLVKSFM